jgi:hypothetical protein
LNQTTRIFIFLDDNNTAHGLFSSTYTTSLRQKSCGIHHAHAAKTAIELRDQFRQKPICSSS